MGGEEPSREDVRTLIGSPLFGAVRSLNLVSVISGHLKTLWKATHCSWSLVLQHDLTIAFFLGFPWICIHQSFQAAVDHPS
jgi:hypothetical protein